MKKLTRLMDLIRGWRLTFFNRNIQTNTLKVFIERFSRLEVGKNAKILFLGQSIKISRNCRICVRDSAEVSIGKRFFMNDSCQIICRKKISIGDDVQFGQSVMVFDHDHDFRIPGGIREDKFTCSDIIIGNGVWIGANTIILRGTIIGDNCIVGAGSVIKGAYDNNSVIVQKRCDNISFIGEIV